jgi:hypothetical protein
VDRAFQSGRGAKKNETLHGYVGCLNSKASLTTRSLTKNLALAVLSHGLDGNWILK